MNKQLAKLVYNLKKKLNSKLIFLNNKFVRTSNLEIEKKKAKKNIEQNNSFLMIKLNIKNYILKGHTFHFSYN